MADEFAFNVEEEAGSPSYVGSAQERSATRVLKIDWASITSLYLALFPPPVAGISSLPALCPGSTRLYAASVHFEPWMGKDDTPYPAPEGFILPASYDFARATIEYRTIAYERTETQQIMTRRVSQRTEYLAIPGYSAYWSDTNEAITNPDIMHRQRIIYTTHEWTLHRVVTVPWDGIRTMLGCSNQYAWNGAAAEMVLFAGCEVQQEIASDESIQSQVTLHFEERRISSAPSATWNYAIDTDGQWRPFRLGKPGSSQKMYPPQDFYQLT